jgi:hypothetical protein
MKLLFISEGTRDLGYLHQQENTNTNKPAGVICLLVKKIIAEHQGYYPDYITEVTCPIARFHKNLRDDGKEGVRGLANKVKYAIKQLADPHSPYNDCDGIVFIVDQDNQEDRLKEMINGRTSARLDHKLQPIKIALGVAIKELEAWLLADTKALQTVFAGKMTNYSDPENVNDPKQIIEDICESDPRTMPEKFQAIVEEINMEELKTKCKKGFGAFYNDFYQEIIPEITRKRK